MKGGIIASIIILAIVAGTAGHTVYITNRINRSISEVEAAETEPNALKAVYDDFRRIEWLLSLTISDEHLHQVEISFDECISLVKEGELSEAKIVKNRLTLELQQIKRFSGFNIKSIF